MSDPFELGKKYDLQDTRNNTRRQNTAAGAAMGGAFNAAVGGSLGAAMGASRARGHAREMKALGAASRTTTARLVARHTAGPAARGAVALGSLGVLAGGVGGAISRAKRKPVRKNARRMDPAPATARFAGALPKHSPEAQAVAQAAATKRTPPVAAAVRGTLRATTIAKAEDPFRPTVMAKSAFGERGDKRNTKYAGAGLAGATVGSGVGRRLGAKAAGTSMPGIYTQAAGHHLAAADMGIAPERGALRSGVKALKGVHGVKSMLVGDLVGSTAGAAAGAAAVHRRRARRGVAKSAFEPVAKKKIPAVLPGEKVAPRGFEPRKLPAAAGRGGTGRGAQGQRRVVRSGKV